MALLLSVLGMFGLVAYRVEQRRHELAIRGALGATALGLATSVALSALQLAATSIAIGLTAAIGPANAVRHVLYGVGVLDTSTFAGTAIAMLAASLAAVVLAARQVLRIAPAAAMRST